MYPGFRGMSTYPYPSTQMPYTQHYYPSWDAAHSQVMGEPAVVGPPSMYESWPQNFGHPAPVQFPNCYHPAQYPPAYCNFRPPCTHFPSAPPPYGHFCGGYPSHPQPQPSYPVSYVPPPHYTVELPKYEYDKNALREFHCYGCSKHSCHVKEGKNVKIEEHEPEVDTKKSEALVPAGTSNLTHPILWFQPGYTMNKERQPIRLVDNEAEKQHVSPYVRKPQWQRSSVETDAEEHQESPRPKKLLWQQMPSESEAREHLEFPPVKNPQQSMKIVEQNPNAQYGWFPLDMNCIKELLEGGQGRKARKLEKKGGDTENAEDMEKNEQDKQFPFPIIWMPYDRRGENHAQGQEENDVGEAPGKEASPPFKFIPMKLEHSDNEPVKSKTAVGDNASGIGTRETEKTSNLKTIPVKQLEESVPEPSKKDERKEEGSPLKIVEGNRNAQSSSLTKKSKLPPICLRVDSPRKKNGNGSSRSRSPPVDKKQQFEEAKAGERNKEIKVAEAVDKTPSQSKSKVPHKAGEDRKEKHEGDAEKKGVEGLESQEAKESKPLEPTKLEKKILLEQEAATIIQSVYRGYAARKWEPLKKLRQIAKIREDAAEVKRHIEDLESRAGSSTIDDKEKTIVAETIMSLLLKLDTIQGLHPSFRDVRKSVAKELIILQEKLDSLINEKSSPMAQESYTVEESSKVSGQDEGSKGAETTEAQETSTSEEHSKDSGRAEGSKSVVETAGEPSNVSSQFEGSEAVETIQEPSYVCGLDESFRDIGQASEESSDSKEEITNAKACEERVVPMLNEFSSVQPFTSQDVVGVPEYEETSLVEMEPQNKPQGKNTSNSPVPTIVDSQTNMKEKEIERIETVLEKLPGESHDQPIGIDTVENTTEQVGVSSSRNDEQVNLVSKLPRQVVEEDTNEISQVEDVEGSVQESIESAPSALTCDALEVESGWAEKDEGSSTLQAGLPQEVVEEGMEEYTNEILSSEILSRDQEKDQSGDDEGEATLAKFPSVEVESETVGMEMKQSEAVVEEAAPAEAEAGFQVSEVPGTSSKKEDDEKSPEAHGSELHENQVSHNVDIRGLVDREQERSLEKEDSVGDKQTLPGRENKNDEDSVGDKQTLPGHENKNDEAGIKAPCAPNTVEAEDEEQEVPSKESKVDQEEAEIEKKIIEENEKLREMVEWMIASGKEQQDLISSLSGKLKDLEKKMALKKKKKKMKSSKGPRILISRALPSNGNGALGERPMSVASIGGG